MPNSQLGVAYAEYVRDLLSELPGVLDYIEVPFELLQHEPSAVNLREDVPIVLHCASLSLAGSLPAPRAVFQNLRHWIAETGTPWLGEHLSFITADSNIGGRYADEYAPGQPYNLGYTVGPPMNIGMVQSICEYYKHCTDELGIAIILENSPIYFTMPGTTMRQVEFISEIAQRSGAGLLLDISHFLITSRNMQLDPFAEILEYPLDKVVEMHISGCAFEEGALWDDHACRASEETLALFRFALERSNPKCVTLEYNWSATFPRESLLTEISRTREVLSCVGRKTSVTQ